MNLRLFVTSSNKAGNQKRGGRKKIVRKWYLAAHFTRDYVVSCVPETLKRTECELRLRSHQGIVNTC